MSTERNRWQALLQMQLPELEHFEEAMLDDAFNAIQGLIELLPQRLGKGLSSAMNLHATAVEEALEAGNIWGAMEVTLVATASLRAGLSQTVAGRYRASLQELQRLHQCWWDGFGGSSELLGTSELAQIPVQAVEVAGSGLPIKQRQELRQLLLPRLRQFLMRSHRRSKAHHDLMDRVRSARLDEVMARRKLGLPEEGVITSGQVRDALNAVAAAEPDAHPNRKRRWQQAAENLNLLICADVVLAQRGEA